MARGSYHEMISDVTDKEMQWVGQDGDQSIVNRALYTECVRRIQVWTLEWLADSLKTGDPMEDMFRQLAHGVNRVSQMDLYMGEEST